MAHDFNTWGVDVTIRNIGVNLYPVGALSSGKAFRLTLRKM